MRVKCFQKIFTSFQCESMSLKIFNFSGGADYRGALELTLLDGYFKIFVEVIFMKDSYTVKIQWDDEAKVWWGYSDDIQGLILEGDTAEELIQRMLIAAPEMMELDKIEKCSKINFVLSRQEQVVYD